MSNFHPSREALRNAAPRPLRMIFTLFDKNILEVFSNYFTRAQTPAACEGARP